MSRISASHWRGDIQGLRAVAVFLVVAFHANLPIPGGFLGVDVFFVISGYVIAGLLLREWQTHGRIQLSRFYARRFKRLIPALSLTVTVTILLGVLIVPVVEVPIMAQTGLGAILLVANAVIASSNGDYFAPKAEWNPLLNTWSLSVEEQFYLIFPTVLILTLSWKRWIKPTKAAFLVVGLLGLASLGLSLIPAQQSGIGTGSLAWLLGFYSPLTRIWEFAVGALLAIALTSSRRAGIGRRTSFLSGLLGLVLILVAAFWAGAGDRNPGGWNIVAVLGTFMVIWAGAGEFRVGVTRILSHRTLLWIGNRSYSWYLWHWPLIVLVGFLFSSDSFILAPTAAVSLAVAAFAYRWVEEPLREYRPPDRKKWRRLAGLTITPPFLVSLAVITWTALPVWPPITTFDVRSHVADEGGCQSWVLPTERTNASCSWNPNSRGRPIYLVGDSNAAQLTGPVLKVSDARQRPLTVVTQSMAQVMDVSSMRQVNDELWSARSQEYFEDLLTWLQNKPPGDVLIAGSDQVWTVPAWEVRSETGVWSADRQLKAAMREEGLVKAVRKIEGYGHDVLLIHAPPYAPGEVRESLRRRSGVLTSMFAGAQTFSMAAYLEDHQPARTALVNAARLTDSVVIDFIDDVCPTTDACMTRDGSLPVFRDGTHLGVEFANTLFERFDQALEKAADSPWVQVHNSQPSDDAIRE